MKVYLLDVLNTPPCFANSCNWRLPTLEELSGLPSPPELAGVLVTGGIVDQSAPGCGTLPNSPCINPIFGPTYLGPALEIYWTSTEDGGSAYGIDFGTRKFQGFPKLAENYARAVRDP